MLCHLKDKISMKYLLLLKKIIVKLLNYTQDVI
jgi:hypothetical protein